MVLTVLGSLVTLGTLCAIAGVIVSENRDVSTSIGMRIGENLHPFFEKSPEPKGKGLFEAGVIALGVTR